MKPRLLALSLPLLSCNSPATGIIQLTTGGETDTFTRSPAPTALKVDSIDSSGTSTTLYSGALASGTVDLGTLDQTQTGYLDVRGLDSGGNTLVHGTSVSLQFGALAGGTLPVFVQRVGEMARMPGGVDARPAPLASSLTQRFVFVTGGSDSSLATSTQIYDYATFSALTSPPTMPRAALSLAITGTQAWIIDGKVDSANSDYGATAYDLGSDTSGFTNPPMGLAYADVAGGATVTAKDGSQIIVGGTRAAGMPTAAVLVIDSTGTQYAAQLSAPRLGATAAWSDEFGVVVIGGSTTAPGAEQLAPSMASGSPVVSNGKAFSYPADPTIGAGATPLDGQHILVAGGTGAGGKDAGARVYDLGCSMQCTTATWVSSLPATLTFAQAFGIDPANALVVGSESGGTTHVYRLTSAAATELPLKIPRNNARAVLSPLGTVAVLGGGSATMESFSE